MAGSPKHIRGKHELEDAVKKGVVKVYKIRDEDLVNKMLGKLHRGEVETILAGKELNVDFVLIDEKSAREQTKNFFLVSIGTFGILRIAKKDGLINEIKPLIDKLMLEGYWVSDSLYNQILEDEGEL